jgi:lipopolysaccharide transport system ATP-binding protein
MRESIIQVNHLSKQFRIGASQVGYKTFREALIDSAAYPFRKAKRWLKPSSVEDEKDNHIWALKDVSFEIRRGEVVGLIGRNGAGKSTMLKILSRITEPTEGSVDLYGRVGSLLEVGTGFHPELTGRENLFLSGAILGMKRREIDRKLEQIVEFAEIGRFLDTAVKHYSSGMYLRLAFSVAAHLDPDILLVDEVLAVGDLAFQQKCLNHMRGLTQSGMTIILVSHNMAAIQSSCQRVLLINNGQLIADDDPIPVIERYRKMLETGGSAGDDRLNLAEISSDEFVSIQRVQMYDTDGQPRREFSFGEPISIQIDLDAKQRIERPMINFGLRRGDGTVVCNFNNWYDNFEIDYIEGHCTLTGWLPPLRLVPDFYEIHVLVWPWGGGHLQGDMARMTPYAWSTFGTFHVGGIGLNAHDGVYQNPASKWIFRRGETVLESQLISEDSIFQALNGEKVHET